ncbi:MAG: hypothetical protein UMV23_02235 [Halanaerobium sp.]|nr:hypothetical protein [Halanaerobium sp.]
MEVVGVSGAMLLIAIYQVSRLRRRREYRKLLAFSVLWVLSSAYAILVSAEVKFPSPFDIIMELTALAQNILQRLLPWTF